MRISRITSLFVERTYGERSNQRSRIKVQASGLVHCSVGLERTLVV